jgi:hypothetical protein
VQNLCPGGAVTLAFTAKWWDSSNTEGVYLVATSRPEGAATMTEEYRLTLNKSNLEWQRVEPHVWTINTRQ